MNDSFFSRTSKISLGIFSLGLLIIAYSIIRWFFLYPDYSTLTTQSIESSLAVSIGFGCLFSAYVYNWMRFTERELRSHKDRLDAVVDFWMSREKESILDKAKGVTE